MPRKRKASPKGKAQAVKSTTTEVNNTKEVPADPWMSSLLDKRKKVATQQESTPGNAKYIPMSLVYNHVGIRAFTCFSVMQYVFIPVGNDFNITVISL